MIKYGLTTDMTENRQYCKMLVKTDPQRCGNGLTMNSGCNYNMVHVINFLITFLCRMCCDHAPMDYSVSIDPLHGQWTILYSHSIDVP